jgi:molybdate transport system ATP-binding protein
MNEPFLSLEALTVNVGGKKLLEDINLLWEHDQQWAIVGPSGSGKTVLAHVLAGKYFFEGRITSVIINPEQLNLSVVVVEQQHRFKNIFNRQDFYYQQRYNSSESENTMTVSEALAEFQSKDNPDKGNVLKSKELTDLLQLEALMDEPLIQLSNGENKRLQLLEALLLKKELLILDQPFVGLDINGREILHGILGVLSKKGQKLLIICSGQEIPECFTHVMELKDGKVKEIALRSQFHFSSQRTQTDLQIEKQLFSKAPVDLELLFEYAIRMNDVNVRYGDKQILQRINWDVKRGERWSLSGPNGAGKSTLLSLITGDNTQAYANVIYLFDRRRGTGESIWDIKKMIGYVSPELHLYFDATATTRQTIASGFFDTIGLFRHISEEQEEAVNNMMKMLSISDKSNKIFSALSVGTQRLALLARALIKNPPLLILDEPCQGLDVDQTVFFRGIVDRFCNHFKTTLIYISHNAQELPRSINCFIRLQKGKTVSIHNGNHYT